MGHNDGPVITVVRGSTSSVAGHPMSMPSLGSPSSSSSAHNMTEEEGQVESHYGTGHRNQNTSKQSKDSLSSNAASNVSSANSIASAGLFVLDLFRETVNRNKRVHNKEKSEHRTENGKRPSDLGTANSQSVNTERETAASIAVLENVIEKYNTRSSTNNSIESSSGPGNSNVIFCSFAYRVLV